MDRLSQGGNCRSIRLAARFRFDETPVMQRQADYPSESHSLGHSLVDLLRHRAAAMAEKHVFSFLRGNGEEEETSLTYQALDERARAIAGELQALAPPEERALLLFPPGLDFITAFFGCLYAGIVAVPAPIPNRNRLTTSVEAIFKASRPSLVLSTADHREQAKRTYARHAGLAQRPWIAVDRVGPERQHAVTRKSGTGRLPSCNTPRDRPPCPKE